ncbi:hypothetical protein N474_22870 [Pseudoalteromonas luteoviolacea CPMOR-2]|uniref:Uncharacterized protein n=1 Tax=Pseudoalteromonas luteoviolacea DSM 6061 TaxID=1365250 RepID=A0A166YQG6_9GAMM|nr:hypothetical protein [Pseudoalteromonas luteoviolacea]KZN43266.1 hypothetical protein N475_09185 [Pseudoalteromonas luteoviolacea DSM 6061]KZN52681.1 hypothetical protein N474_22870 [Pseudoalteromonas luteoviolacea CPMOR-2]MBE0385467.1 hypothetical protein [Pseudoalteromonas luteoviolacea DSM 6061]
MRRERRQGDIVYVVFTTVLVYFLFKITLIFSIVLDRKNRCLSSIWESTNAYFNPYWTFLILAILSCVWFFYSSLKLKLQFGKTTYLLIVVGLTFYYFWFKGFYGLWLFLQYEQQQISQKMFFEKTGEPERLNLYGVHLDKNRRCIQ